MGATSCSGLKIKLSLSFDERNYSEKHGGKNDPVWNWTWLLISVTKFENDREPQNTLCLYLASSLLSLTTQITIKSQWKQYPIFWNSTRDKSSQRVRLTCTLSEVHRTFVIHKDLESVLICFIFRDMHLCISHLIRIKRYFVLR